jgi:hypothetical protein
MMIINEDTRLLASSEANEMCKASQMGCQPANRQVNGLQPSQGSSRAAIPPIVPSNFPHPYLGTKPQPSLGLQHSWASKTKSISSSIGAPFTINPNSHALHHSHPYYYYSQPRPSTTQASNCNNYTQPRPSTTSNPNSHAIHPSYPYYYYSQSRPSITSASNRNNLSQPRTLTASISNGNYFTLPSNSLKSATSLTYPQNHRNSTFGHF